MKFGVLNYLVNLILFVYFPFLGKAQPAVQWQKCYGNGDNDYFAGMVEAFGGGHVMAGRTQNCKYGNGDFWVVKIDDTGAIAWTKCFGGSLGEYANNIVKVRGDFPGGDGYMVLGSTNSNDGDVTVNHGSNDYWVVKLDTSGNLQWQKTYGGLLNEEAYSATQTTDGGIVIAGHTSSNDGDVTGNHGDYDWWILKTDQLGNNVWKKTLGGSKREFLQSIAPTNDGGVIITGSTQSSDGDVSQLLRMQDVWLVKLSASGAMQWNKSYGSSAGLHTGWSVVQTSDNGYALSATTFNYPSPGLNHGFIKLNDTGAVQWTVTQNFWDLIEIGNKHYITTGTTSAQDGYVSRIDSTGAVIWTKPLGGSDIDHTRKIFSTKDGGYIVAGNTRSNDGM